MEAAEVVRALIARSNAGDPAAMTEVGRRFLDGRQAPKSLERGAALIVAAAEKGWPEAIAASAVLAAAGLLGAPNWQAALAQLARAAALGHQASRAQLRVLEASETSTAPAPIPISETPRLWWLRRLLTEAECLWLIDRARGRLELATVYDREVGGINATHVRTNSLFAFTPSETDLIVLRLQARLAEAFGVTRGRLEVPNVLHYAPGQQFGRHCDFLQPAHPAFAEEINRNGQRIGTAIVYLNDGYEGGETEFPALRKSVRGEVGDAICLRNVDVSGRPDTSSLHAGLAPTSGEKWAFAQFIRSREQG